MVAIKTIFGLLIQRDTWKTRVIKSGGHCYRIPIDPSLRSRWNLHVKQVVLVSGFYQSIDDEGFSELMLPAEGFDYDRIRSAADEIVLINSDNDPWGCDDKQARPVAEALGASFVLAKGQGHMGTNAFNQPMPELPLLKDILRV